MPSLRQADNNRLKEEIDIARRFKAKETTIKRELMNTMKKVEATSLKIEMDEFTGAVKVIFDRNNRRYTKSCAKWENSLDNLRAIGLSIEYLYRAITAYGVTSEDEEFNRIFELTFTGYEATPDDTVLMIENDNAWNSILGVSADADKTAIINAFKAMARVHHPDAGGDKETFIRLRKAYEEGIGKL